MRGQKCVKRCFLTCGVCAGVVFMLQLVAITYIQALYFCPCAYPDAGLLGDGMNHRTQCKRILDRLLGYGRGLTSLEAAQMSPPIMRLSERVRELEADGCVFMRTKEQVQGCSGKYTRYWLKSMDNYQGDNVEKARVEYMGSDDKQNSAREDRDADDMYADELEYNEDDWREEREMETKMSRL